MRMFIRRLLFNLQWKFSRVPGPAKIKIGSWDQAFEYFKEFGKYHDGTKWTTKTWAGGLHSAWNGISVIGIGEQYCEDSIEEILNHEVMHDILHRMFGFNTSKKFDDIQAWRQEKIVFWNKKKDQEV